MNKLKTLALCALGLLLVGLLAGEADACTRCGFRGRLCRFAVVDHHAVAQVVAAPYVPAQPQLLVVQNQYAAPNGAAALLAPQGNAVYGLQGAVQPYVLDPTAVLRQAAELTRGAQQLASQGLTGYNTTASLALQLNAPANETLAKGVAASATLHAAGLSAPSANQSQALRITRGADGRFVVEDVTQQATVTAQTRVSSGSQTTELPRPEAPPPEEPASNVGQLVRQHCAACHGLDKADPKGGVYLDVGHPLSQDVAKRARQLVQSGKMPQGQALPAEVVAALRCELAELSLLGSATTDQ